MTRMQEIYMYQARGMVQFILEGHSESETAKEFNVTCKAVRNRLQWIGYTYAELVELRESRLANAKQNKKPE